MNELVLIAVCTPGGDSGVQALALALRQATHLQSLSLSNSANRSHLPLGKRNVVCTSSRPSLARCSQPARLTAVDC